MNSARVIKKYPNRRLYDTVESCYITLADVRTLVIRKINFVKSHTRATQTGRGGIIEKEGPIHVSNIQLVCPKCNQPTRIKIDWMSDGKKVRICKKCGEMIV